MTHTLPRSAAVATPLARSFARALMLTLAGASLIAIAAQIRIPLYPVPVTLQSLAIFLIASALGLRLGVAAVSLYLVAGIVGAPVFSAAAAGFSAFAGPTGGYLVGFILAAIYLGIAADKNILARTNTRIAALIYATAIIFVPGIIWLNLLTHSSIETSLQLGLFPFLPGAVVKIAAATVLIPALPSRARH